MRQLMLTLTVLLSLTHCLRSFGQQSPHPILIPISLPGTDSVDRVLENLDYIRAMILFVDTDGAVFVLDRTSPQDVRALGKPLPKQPIGAALQEQILKARQAIDKQYGLNREEESQFRCIIKTLPGSDMSSVVKVMDVVEACKQYPFLLTDNVTVEEKDVLKIR